MTQWIKVGMSLETTDKYRLKTLLIFSGEYKYEWTLLEHPEVEEGETVGNMEDKNTANLKLSEVCDVIKA